MSKPGFFEEELATFGAQSLVWLARPEAENALKPQSPHWNFESGA